MDKIEVTIKPEHFRKAVSYISDKNPLEIALNDQYPDLNALVGGSKVLCKHGEFIIPTSTWGGAKGKFPPNAINDLCTKAKESYQGIPTIKFSIVKKKMPVAEPVAEILSEETTPA